MQEQFHRLFGELVSFSHTKGTKSTMGVYAIARIVITIAFFALKWEYPSALHHRAIFVNCPRMEGTLVHVERPGPSEPLHANWALVST